MKNLLLMHHHLLLWVLKNHCFGFINKSWRGWWCWHLRIVKRWWWKSIRNLTHIITDPLSPNCHSIVIICAYLVCTKYFTTTSNVNTFIHYRRRKGWWIFCHFCWSNLIIMLDSARLVHTTSTYSYSSSSSCHIFDDTVVILCKNFARISFVLKHRNWLICRGFQSFCHFLLRRWLGVVVSWAANAGFLFLCLLLLERWWFDSSILNWDLMGVTLSWSWGRVI